ncbi:DUF5709 domain-containing protein [Ornithinicoccus hortensis]|uniref:DUF5709 domain-containing protein n=1 Tax=Ornithinicoccus hortensis TaxID=82346 RepID=A0A542YRV9_9MICO|nr:DUF5709 domain-containing protein [Ornithinicoccus hortensis]TQL50664.1 hypothetical protein FB467_1777 [Ornithinicoccus hortensis]
MSDQPGRENLDNEYGSYSLDDEDQLQPEDTLDGTEDPLDRGYETADRLQGVTAWGTTAEEERTEETIEQRIRQEVPDPDSAYGAPDNESGLDEDRVGGDDPDAIPADRDFLGSEGERVGRLVAPDGGQGEDREKDEVARESRPTGDDSPEESAMHYVRDPEDDLED